MSTLTKADVVDALMESGWNRTQLEAKTCIEDLLKLMRAGIVRDHDLLISGFGKFEAYEKNPRKGRNPQTSEELMLDGRTVCVFRLSRNFRAELNGTPVDGDKE